MRSFTTTELSRMQSAQEEGMMDRCVVLQFTETDRVDEYGTPVSPYVEGPLIACGLDMDPKREANAPFGGGDVTQAEVGEGRIRLPMDTVIGGLDRIMVIERFGVMIEPITYDLIETPRRGPSGLWARVRRFDG